MIPLQKKMFIIILLYILMIFTIAFFIIPPLIGELQEIHGKIDRQKASLEERFQKGQLINVILKEYYETKPQQNILQSVFLQRNKELDFISLLESLSKKYSVSLKISPSQTNGGNNHTLPLQLHIEGQYLQILKFLNAVEKQDIYFPISKISLQQGGENKNAISVTVVGRVYFLNNFE